MRVSELSRYLPGGLADRLNEVNQGETEVSSASYSPRVRPRVFVTAFLVMSSMCPTYTRSRGDIEPARLLGARVRGYARSGTWASRGLLDAHPTPRQLALDADELETRHVTRLELHQHIDVALRTEVVAERRTKQRQARDVTSLAKRAGCCPVDDQVRTHGIVDDTAVHRQNGYEPIDARALNTTSNATRAKAL